MRKLLLIILALPQLAMAGEFPACQAELNDEMNQVLARTEWQEQVYLGSISDGVNRPILISTSAGNDKVMSLWVREKSEGNPNGMFSFVDLSSGKEQYLRFYMANGQSVGVRCLWVD